MQASCGRAADGFSRSAGARFLFPRVVDLGFGRAADGFGRARGGARFPLRRRGRRRLSWHFSGMSLPKTTNR